MPFICFMFQSQRGNKKLLSAAGPGDHEGQGGPGPTGATDISPHGTLSSADSQKFKGQKAQAKGPFSNLFSPFVKVGKVKPFQ